MKCKHCGSTRLSFVPEEDDRRDEPGHAAFYECFDCGAANPDDQDEGDYADYMRELEQGKAA